MTDFEAAPYCFTPERHKHRVTILRSPHCRLELNRAILKRLEHENQLD